MLRTARVSDMARITHILEGLHVAKDAGGLKRLRAFVARGQVLVSRNAVAVLTRWKRTVHIRYFGIHPQRRGCGCGRRAVRQLERWVRAHGFERVTLAAYRLNRGARAFWQAVGFQVYGRRWFGVLLEKAVA